MEFFVIAAIIAVVLVVTCSSLYVQRKYLMKQKSIEGGYSGKELSHSAQLMLGTKSRPQYFLGDVKEIAQKDFKSIELKRSLLGPGNHAALERFIKDETGVTRSRIFTSEVLKAHGENKGFDVKEITDDEWKLIIEAYNDEMYKLRKRDLDAKDTLNTIEDKYNHKQLEWLYRSQSLEQVKKDSEPVDPMKKWDAEFEGR